MAIARGTFEVKLTAEGGADQVPGRMSIDKKFAGDLEAASKGTMLAFMTSVKGSAGYVAMEKVEGRLSGRTGSFVLQHNGTMNRGTPEQSVNVVPDSGTGELTGLAGQMMIIIEAGKHSYELEYTLTDRPS